MARTIYSEPPWCSCQSRLRCGFQCDGCFARSKHTSRDARREPWQRRLRGSVQCGLALLLLGGGGYAADFLGSPFGRVGAFAGMFGGFILVATLVSFTLCLITLRITRLTIKVESTYP